MDEKKPDENQGFGDFNEDFDFGESSGEPRYLTTPSKQGPNKGLLIGIFAVIVVGVSILGYKFFSTGSSKTALGQAKQASTSKTLPAPAPAPTTAPTTPSTTQPATTAQKTPSPATATPAPAAPGTTPPPGKTPKTPSTEQNFGELAQAFSMEPGATPNAPAPPAAAGAAGSSPAPGTPGAPAPATPPTTPPTTSPGTANAPSKEGSIQDLQKELFGNETATPSPAPNAGTTPPGAKGEEIAGANAPTLSGGSEMAETTQMGSNLNKLNQQIEYISNKVKYLDSYTREVSDNLSKLNETINSMDQRLSTLTNTTSTLSKEVGTVRSEMGHIREVDVLELNPSAVAPHRKKGAGDGKISIEDPEYILHAVIPGRAWLKSAKGQILTVTEGDTVGNYGKILVIDAANGVVLTSSGITFR